MIEISQEDGEWLVEGDDTTVARLALFLADRCAATTAVKQGDLADDWSHKAALARAARVASKFGQPVLALFDNHYFWGSWKWIGWFATDCTWVGRWIMHSVGRNDARGIPLCMDWLKSPPCFEQQIVALCFAIQHLSGERARDSSQWVRWYEGGWFSKGAKVKYPEPNFDAWLKEMKAEFGDDGNSTPVTE